MGETAARILLQRMQGFKDYPVEFAVPPELIIRETTASPNAKALRRRVRKVALTSLAGVRKRRAKETGSKTDCLFFNSDIGRISPQCAQRAPKPYAAPKEIAV
jgi:hypothetical protein